MEFYCKAFKCISLHIHIRVHRTKYEIGLQSAHIILNYCVSITLCNSYEHAVTCTVNYRSHWLQLLSVDSAPTGVQSKRRYKQPINEIKSSYRLT